MTKPLSSLRIEELECARMLYEMRQIGLSPREYIVSESQFFFAQFKRSLDVQSSVRLWKSFLLNLFDRLHFLGLSDGYRQDVTNIIREKLFQLHRECDKRGLIYDLL